jgi:chemotaxis protein methyltransferase CheR
MIVMANSTPSLTDAEFRKWQALIQREAGIHLSVAKKALLVGRLARRLRARGTPSFGAYHDLVERDAAERIEMLDAICTNETHFFREPRQFEFLADRVFPAWRAAAAAGQRSRTVRVWSAACSFGEEPYSLAMSLLAHLPAEAGWSVEIVATDLSTKALSRAQDAVWPIEKAEEIPPAFCRRFMLRGVGSQQGKMKAGPALRAVVRFARLNLSDASYAVGGAFDLILCRNVLIYFGADEKKAVIARLLDRLTPEGILFLGHSETLHGINDRVRSVGPTAYSRSDAWRR